MKTFAKAIGVLAALLLVLGAASLPGEAQAATTILWSDSSTSNVYGGCNPITANGGMPYRWHMGAHDLGSYAANYGDIFSGFPSSYVAFYVYDLQQRRYVFADTAWRLIPKGFPGLEFANMTWGWGPGSFTIHARLWHNGQQSEFVNIGRMTWHRYPNGQMLCYNL